MDGPRAKLPKAVQIGGKNIDLFDQRGINILQD